MKNEKELCFPPGNVGDSDLERWINEGLILSDKPGMSYILEQRQGGPCGVIAVLQGLLLQYLIFQENLDLSNVTKDDARRGLIEAMSGILDTAKNDKSISLCSGKVKENEIETKTFTSLDQCKEYLAENMKQYVDAGGLMLFIYSLIKTRTVSQIRQDMDDPTGGLTGQFGHCTQELMNLLLCGVASSQVHDGNVDLGDGLTLRGIPCRPRIGYLTHLEALRYCQVGTYYKKPIYPIWVIGSDSHYTVLYGLEKNINEESLRQEALNRAKRAFNELDQQENGFIAIEKLDQVLTKLNLSLNQAQISNLISKCEMQGSGIILWLPFWTHIKPFLLPSSDWACPFCTFINDRNTDVCGVCENRRKNQNDDGEEEDDDSPHTIQLVHINGLISTKQGVVQGPKVTPFSLTTVSKDLQAPSTHGHGEPIEEVLHTRWSGSVFGWPNDIPANING